MQQLFSCLGVLLLLRRDAGQTSVKLGYYYETGCEPGLLVLKLNTYTAIHHPDIQLLYIALYGPINVNHYR